MLVEEKMDFEEWMDLQAENPMFENYYYRDMKSCWQAATERAAKIAEESCFCKSGWCLCGSYRVAAKIRETGGR